MLHKAANHAAVIHFLSRVHQNSKTSQFTMSAEKRPAPSSVAQLQQQFGVVKDQNVDIQPPVDAAPAAPTADSKQPRLSDDQANPTNAPSDPAVQQQQGMTLKQQMSKYIIYDYKTFDPEKIVFSKKIYESKVGGVEMIYLNYIFPDGCSSDLWINTPRLFSSLGVQRFENEGKEQFIIYLSADNNWASDPEIMAFKNVLDAILNKTCKYICESRKDKWLANKTVGWEELLQYFSPLFSETKDPSGNVYSPSVKLVVVPSYTATGFLDKKRTRFIQEQPNGALVPTMQSGFIAQSYVSGIIHPRWVSKKKENNTRNYPFGASFSFNVAAFQLVRYADEEFDDECCAVQIKTRNADQDAHVPQFEAQAQNTAAPQGNMPGQVQSNLPGVHLPTNKPNDESTTRVGDFDLNDPANK